MTPTLGRDRGWRPKLDEVLVERAEQVERKLLREGDLALRQKETQPRGLRQDFVERLFVERVVDDRAPRDGRCRRPEHHDGTPYPVSRYSCFTRTSYRSVSPRKNTSCVSSASRRRSRSRNPCSSAFAVRSLLRNSTAAMVRSRGSSRPWRFVNATWSASMISRPRLSCGFATSRTRPRTIGSDAGSSQRTFARTARSSSTAKARPWCRAFPREIPELPLYRGPETVKPSAPTQRRIF